MKKLFTLFLALVAGVGTMFASDTQVNGIWYNFDSSTQTASVTYRGSSATAYSNEYSGSVTIPASVTYNGTTYSVTSIGDGAFANCTGLTYITIPNSVTSIGDAAFANCTGLTYITIPNSVTSIGQLAFHGCTGLTSVTIPNSVTSIGYAAFIECTGLTSVTIPNSVTSIGDIAFAYCTGLTSITIPNSVTTIGDGAFGCTGLTSIYNYAETPQNINANVFDGDGDYPAVDKSTCILYVPAESVDTYKAADVWKEFINILPISAEEKNVDAVEVETSESAASIAWPQVSGAYSYELVIKDKDGNIVCTLVFNAQGQLLSIKFNAPAQNGAPQHTQAAGFAFTITGLNSGSWYNYTLTSKNESGTVLNVVEGTFRTQSLEAVDEVSDGQSRGTKFFRNGQVLIQKGDKTFDLRGQEVR